MLAEGTVVNQTTGGILIRTFLKGTRVRIAKKATFIGAAALTTAGVIAGLAVPANADPANPNPTSESQEAPLVGVGSDTIQDLFTGLSAVMGDNWDGTGVIASYDATAPGTTAASLIKPRVLGHQFIRPNGSGAGLTALTAAVDPSDAHEVGNSLTDSTSKTFLSGSDVQFARSSDFSTIKTDGGGKYAQIPIAIDAVTYATASTSNIPSGIALGDSPQTASSNSASPNALTLKNIFGGRGYLSDGTHKFYSGSLTQAQIDSGYTKLDVYVPQAGSGTRKFWLKTLEGITDNTLPDGVTDQFNGTTNEEHDGTALQGDPNAIAPFSIAQWIAQSDHASLSGAYGVTVIDRRHGAQLNAIGSSQPTTSGKLNTAFPVSRPVFVRVEYSQLKVNPYLKAAFVSDSNNALTSTVYAAANPVTGSSTIEDFGFAKIPSSGYQSPVLGSTVFFAGDADDYRFDNQ
jgi:ABC-type phosphate transport system substrate-binding protein